MRVGRGSWSVESPMLGWRVGFVGVSHDGPRDFSWATFRAVPEVAHALELLVGGKQWSSLESISRCVNGHVDHLRGTCWMRRGVVVCVVVLLLPVFVGLYWVGLVVACCLCGSLDFQ